MQMTLCYSGVSMGSDLVMEVSFYSHSSHLLWAHQLYINSGLSLTVKCALSDLWRGCYNSLRGCHVTLRLLHGAAGHIQYCCSSAFFQGHEGSLPLLAVSLLRLAALHRNKQLPLFFRFTRFGNGAGQHTLHRHCYTALRGFSQDTPPLPLSAAQLPLFSVYIPDWLAPVI